ncbi:MAG: hypothetical protein E6G87_02680, partial [Alphaproteobacteria bacterium]
DPQTAKLADGVDPSTFFVRLTKRLVVLLQDVTEDGYTFRVDLRLRPDPRATQVAISIEAAAIYYENMGQNWERAAMIKARPVAGDLALGREFLDRLIPYIWRKYLDFAAIADVQSLKRQIHAVKGHGTIAVRGHNIKLGRGGIREIEYLVKTQQLIAGGRNAKLRGRRTLDMLKVLEEAKWISPANWPDLMIFCAGSSTGSRWWRTSRPRPCPKMKYLSKAWRGFPVSPMRRPSRRNCAALSSWYRAITRHCSRMPRISAPMPAASSSPAARTTLKRSRPSPAWASSGRARLPR